MKKMSIFKKIILSILVLVILFFAISIIDSIIFNKDKKGKNDKYFHITYMLVDKDKVSDDFSFDSFSRDMVNNLDYVYHFYQTEVNVEKEGEYYIADISNMNKVVLDNIKDSYFSVTNLNAQTVDDIRFDGDKLKVYIPKKYYEDDKYRYEGTNDEVLDTNSPVQAEFLSEVTNKDYAKVEIELNKIKFNKKTSNITIDNNTSYTKVKINKDNTNLSNKDYKVYINDDKYPLDSDKYSYSSKTGELKIDYYPIQINKIDIKYRKFSIFSIFGLNDAEASVNPIIGTYSGTFTVGMEETYFLPYMYGSTVANRNATCSPTTYLYCGGQISSNVNCASLSSNWVSKQQVCTAWQSYMDNSVIASDGLRAFALRLVNQPGGSGAVENITEIADVPVSFNYDWLNADCETHFTSFNNSNAALPVSFRVTEVDANGVVTIEFNSKYSSGGQLAGGRFRLKRGTPQAKAKAGVNISLNKTFNGQDYSNAVFGYTIDDQEIYLNSQAKVDYMDIFNVMQSIYTALGQGEDRKGIIHNTTLVYNAGGLNTRVSGGYLSYITNTIAKEHGLEGQSLTTAKRAVGEILLGSSWSATDAAIEKMTWSQVVYSTLNLNILRGTASEIASTESCDGVNILDTNSSLACDATTDNNLRFIGNNPNNYISFNGEKWRIIGFMNNIKSNETDATGETRIKIVRESIGKGRYERYSNSYATSAINTLLNGTYYNGLTNDAKALIDNISWNIGGFNLYIIDNNNEGHLATLQDVYNIERGNIGSESTPNITTWKGNIGLIYPTDYYFAVSGTSNEERQRCLNTTLPNDLSLLEDCYNNNWLKASNADGYWTISGASYSTADWTPGQPDGIYVGYNLITESEWGHIYHPYGFVDWHTMYWGDKALRPTVYLKPDVAIASGTGTVDDPYVLGNSSSSVNVRYSATTNEASDATNGDTTVYQGSFGDILTLNGVDRASADFYVKELIADDTGIVPDDRIYKISVSYVASDPTTEAGLKTGTYSYTVYRSNDASNWQTMYTRTLPNQNIEDFPTITLTNQDAHFNDPENGNFENTGDCCDDHPKYGAIKVKKELERAESGDSLIGYKFKVHNVSTNTDSYIYTDSTGVATYGYILGNFGLKVGTSYEVSEVVDNDGYAIRLVDGVEKSSNFKPRNNTTKNVVISSDTVNDFYVVSYTNYKKVYCAKVVKVDSETNKPLKGTTFTLSDGQTGTTDANGVVIFTNLNDSSYTVTETTIDGTKLIDDDDNTYEYHNDDPTPHALTIVEENYNDGAFSCPIDVPTSFVYKDTKTYYCLKVKKTDAVSGLALEGAVFEISSTGKTPVESTATTNNNGVASFFIGDSSNAGKYDVEETVAPTGYSILPIIQNVDVIAMEHYNSANEAKAACKTDTVKDINGELISAVTYDSNNGDNSYVFKDNKENDLLLNFFKVNENSTYINGAEFKVFNSNNKFITVSSNKMNITDTNNVTKKCYIYTGVNSTGSSLYMDDVSPNHDGSMSGEICIAGLPSGTYTAGEITPVSGHTLSSAISKSLSTSSSFRSRTSDFVNEPTKLVFTKHVVDKDGQDITPLDQETIDDIIAINFNIYSVNDNGEKVGSKIEVIKTADGVYEYANNVIDGTTGTPTTDLNVRASDLQFEVYHLPYGKYIIEEESNSGYYIVNKNYSLFEIDKCSNRNASTLRCINPMEAEASLDNTITEIEFNKEDIYDYYKNTDSASSISNDKLFDTISFVLRDNTGNIVDLIDLGNGNYKYGSGVTVNTIHTTNGNLKITKLPRNSVYYIEEISTDAEGNFVLRTDLSYDNLPFDNQGHPVVKYELDEVIEISTYISKTGVIQNIPTRVVFEKKDAKYGYTITDETTTFKVYQCTNLGEGEHCTENNGTLINFESRSVINDDLEDPNIEVYRYKKNNASGVTELNPYNGKLVLRYLPSDSKYSYVLVETKAPEGYLLPTNGDQYTEFDVSNNDVNEIAIAVDNQPTGVLIYKYNSETGGPLPGAKFKIYKVINYDSTKTIEEQTKELISLKEIRDGEYEYSLSPTTDILITCDDNNGTCEKQNPKTIAGGLFRNGTILIEYLPNDNYYIIEEVEAPLGYEIDENNKYKLIYLEENETSVEYTSVYNTPTEGGDEYYCLKVKKTDKVTNEGLGGAVFTISNPTKTPVMSSATTNNEGIASFFIGTIDNVGDYTVTETKAPNGYYLSNNTLTVRPIKLSPTESVEEARRLCLTNNATDSEGVIISSYTYNSNDPNIRSRFIISNNKSLLNIYKKDNNNNGVNNVTFKIKKDNSYVTVKDLNSDNEITLDDRVSVSDGNSTKLCYVYDSLDIQGSNLISGDVSVNQDNSMNGELCVSSLEGNEESTTAITYIVKEMSSTDTLINKREEKEIASSRYFQVSGDLNTFINYPTYVKLIKNVDNTYSSSEGSGLSDITTNELMNIPFTINDSNDNPVPITMTASGEYIYDSNSSNTVMYINQSREIVVRGLPKGNYTFIELNNDECQSGVDSIGYYNQTRSYPFTIDDCSSETGFDTETCQNRITTVDMLNIPTELDFTKKDFYSDETGTFVDDKERSDFDKIGFKVKDSSGNYIRFIKIGNNGTCNDDDSYSIYRAVYGNTSLETVDTLNTCGGHIKILNLHRGETYTIEEVSVPDDSIYVLEGHPSITVKIGCEGEVGRTSTTAVISDKPSRVVFEKKDAKYGYTILDETTTFNVYRCEIGSVCNSTTGELVHFYERNTIENDEEDSNIEVYKYNRNTDGVTDLHPYNGKLVLRYLPSGYDYILVETKAPNGYLLPVLDAAITRFDVKTDTVDIEEVNIPNLPVGLVIRKYDENGNLLSGAEFKVYKVNNYNPEISLENQDKTELSFKTIIQGVYENRPVLDTNIISVSNVDIDNSYYDYENLDEVYTKSGSKLKDVLKKGTAFISYLENNSYYIVEETKAPKGYTISDNKYTLVHIGENETQIADIEDAFINYPSVYTFYKIDEYNNPLDGAEFVLQKLNRNKVYETLNVTLINNIYKVSNETDNKIITTTNGKASIYYLEEGQYRILEVKNKAGYELTKDNYSATFFVDHDGIVHGEQIIVNKKPTRSEEELGKSQATVIVNIQTGQKVISYMLMILGTLGVITLLIILIKRNNLKRLFSSR